MRLLVAIQDARLVPEPRQARDAIIAAAELADRSRYRRFTALRSLHGSRRDVIVQRIQTMPELVGRLVAFIRTQRIEQFTSSRGNASRLFAQQAAFDECRKQTAEQNLHRRFCGVNAIVPVFAVEPDGLIRDVKRNVGTDAVAGIEKLLISEDEPLGFSTLPAANAPALEKMQQRRGGAGETRIAVVIPNHDRKRVLLPWFDDIVSGTHAARRSVGIRSP